jgi:hypothetical protein
MTQRARNALVTSARFNGAARIYPNHSTRKGNAMKALFASLLAAVLAIAAVTAYPATPIVAKSAFAADTGSPLPSDDDKDKDKDKDKKDG